MPFPTAHSVRAPPRTTLDVPSFKRLDAGVQNEYAAVESGWPLFVACLPDLRLMRPLQATIRSAGGEMEGPLQVQVQESVPSFVGLAPPWWEV